jgi:hypothetical protein
VSVIAPKRWLVLIHLEDIAAPLGQPISGFQLPLYEQNCAFSATVGRKLMRLRAWA